MIPLMSEVLVSYKQINPLHPPVEEVQGNEVYLKVMYFMNSAVSIYGAGNNCVNTGASLTFCVWQQRSGKSYIYFCNFVISWLYAYWQYKFKHIIHVYIPCHLTGSTLCVILWCLHLHTLTVQSYHS